MKQLLIATTNQGKRKEISDLLRELEIEIITPADIAIQQEVEENGISYLENARLKAEAYCTNNRLPTLADDSGLEVDALDGKPGLHSARFTGKPGATDRDRRQLLLSRLAGHPRPWSAHFVCAVILALPNGQVFSSIETCTGEIIPDERGSHGFGYDPIFFFPDMGKTMAELSMIEKNRISHRAKAIQGIIPFIKDNC